MMPGIFERARKVWGLKVNPVDDVEKPPLGSNGDIEVFSPEEVWALVRAAASEQDAAIFLAAAFTGLRRGELVALRWRDVDFAGSVIRVRASYHEGVLTTPKSGKVRSVPMAPDVASALAKLDSAIASRLTTIWRSSAKTAAIWTDRRSAAATTLRANEPACAVFASTICATRSAPDDRQGRHPPGPGVDGTRRHPDDDEVPPLRAARRGCPARR